MELKTGQPVASQSERIGTLELSNEPRGARRILLAEDGVFVDVNRSLGSRYLFVDDLLKTIAGVIHTTTSALRCQCTGPEPHPARATAWAQLLHHELPMSRAGRRRPDNQTDVIGAKGSAEGVRTSDIHLVELVLRPLPEVHHRRLVPHVEV